jgi:prepilin-type N-terminal cleavage/methylation domain-containing protein
MTPARLNNSRAFTLLELIVVMLVISIALALVIPRMGSFLAGSRFNDSADELISMTQYARTQAAADSKVYRLTFTPTPAGTTGYVLSVQEGEQFVPVATEWGRSFEPDGIRMEMVRADKQDEPFIEFRPDATADPATITLQTIKTGETIVIASASPSESFWKISGGRSIGR